MNYQDLSNEELGRRLRERFPGPAFKEVTEENRQTVIAILKISETENRGAKNILPKEQ